MDERDRARISGPAVLAEYLLGLEARLENLQESVNLIDRRTEQILARLTAAGLRTEEYPPDFPPDEE
jgi:hypothetical protein